MMWALFMEKMNRREKERLKTRRTQRLEEGGFLEIC
jgi:hypothetical protein